MTHWLYILHSESTDKYYVGESGNVEQRMEFHNSEGKGFTARYRPWKPVFLLECESRKKALLLEKKIKSWKSKKMIERLIQGEIILD